jgi:cobaltochelatase CobS
MKTKFAKLYEAALAASTTPGTHLNEKKKLSICMQVASDYIKGLAELRAQRIRREEEAKKQISASRNRAGETAQYTIRDVFGSNLPPIPITVRKREPETEAFIPQIDPLYRFRLSVLSGVLTWFHTRGMLRDSLWLYGPTGSGKTSVFEQACARLNIPLFAFEGHERREAPEFFGSWVNGPHGMYWMDGPVTAAARAGGMVLINEGDAIPQSALIGLNGVLEGYPIFIPETKEIIPIKDGFGIAFACNTNGGGDLSGLYIATLRMNIAFGDRFQHVPVNYMEPQDEIEVILSKVPQLSLDLAKEMVRFANEVRVAFLKGTMELTFSTRTLIRWAYLSNFHMVLKQEGGEPLAYALNYALAFRGEEVTRMALLEMAHRVFGGNLDVWKNGGLKLQTYSQEA